MGECDLGECKRLVECEQGGGRGGWVSATREKGGDMGLRVTREEGGRLGDSGLGGGRVGWMSVTREWRAPPPLPAQ